MGRVVGFAIAAVNQRPDLNELVLKAHFNANDKSAQKAGSPSAFSHAIGEGSRDVQATQRGDVSGTLNDKGKSPVVETGTTA